MAVRALAVLVLLLGAALVAAGCGSGADDAAADGTPVLRFTTDRDPTGTIPGLVEQCNEQADGRWRVEQVLMPPTVDAKREQLTRRLAARDESLDLISIDVIWTAEFSEAGWLMDLTERMEPLRELYIPAVLDTAEYQGSIWAAPMATNVALLYYRTDLVDQPPKTWAELKQQAKEIGDANDMAGFLFQANQYEGLTVDAMEFITAFGGDVLDEAGENAVLDQGEGTLEGLRFMQSLFVDGVTPTVVTTFTEEESRLMFQQGEAVFLRNWPYVYALAAGEGSKIVGKYDVVPLPGVEEGTTSGVLGGANLAISAYTRYPDEAWEALQCLSGEDLQRANAVNRGELPALEALYDDPEVRTAQPYLDAARAALDNAHSRPVTPYYSDVSTSIARNANDVAAQRQSPEEAIETMQRQVQLAIEGRGEI